MTAMACEGEGRHSETAETEKMGRSCIVKISSLCLRVSSC